jgi:hypothetical protein
MPAALSCWKPPGGLCWKVQPHHHAWEPPGDRSGVPSLGEADGLEELAGTHVSHREVHFLALVVHRVALDRRRTLAETLVAVRGRHGVAGNLMERRVPLSRAWAV